MVATVDLELISQYQDYERAPALREEMRAALRSGACDDVAKDFVLWCKRAHMGVAVASQAMGELPAARQAFEAASGFNKAGSENSDRLQLMIDAGAALLYYQEGQTEAAADAMVKVARRSQKRHSDLHGNVLYSNAAHILFRVGRIDEAAYWTEEVIALCSRDDAPADCDTERHLHLRAGLMRAKSDFYPAIAILTRLHAHLVETGRESTPFAENTRSMIATFYQELGHDRQALSWAAFDIDRISDMKATDMAVKGSLVSVTAAARSRLSGYDPETTRASIALIDEFLALEPLRPYYLSALTTRARLEAQLAMSTGDPADAATALATADSILSSEGGVDAETRVQTSLARSGILHHLGQTEDAFAMLDTILSTASTPRQRGAAAISAASLAAETGDWARFRRYDTSARELLVPERLPNILSRTNAPQIERLRMLTYDRLKMSMDLRDGAETAFRRAQGVFLNDGGDGFRLALAGANDPELDAARAEIESLLSQRDDLMDAELLDAASGTMEADRLAELARIDNRLIELQAEIIRKRPALGVLAQSEAVGVAQIASALAPAEVSVTIVSGEDTTHIFVVDRDARLSWHPVEVQRSELCALVDRVRGHLDASARPVCPGQETARRAGPHFDTQAAHRLYRLLISPIEDRIAGADTLILSVDGPLAPLPFAVLLAEPERGRDNPLAVPDYGTLQWLVRSHAIIRVPSPRTLVSLSAPRASDGQPGGEGMLAVGAPCLGYQKALGCPEPVEDPVSPIVRGAGLDAAQLPPLPGAADELRQLVRIRPGSHTLLIGAQATEGRVREFARSSYDRVIFATHVLTAGEMGNREPGLVLSYGENGDNRLVPEDDGFLSASEIAAQVRFDSNLVILAGCNSASSLDGNQSTPLNGLARSFFAGGARQIVMSHTPLRDDVSQAFTTRLTESDSDFHKVIQSTMLALLNDADDPTLADPAAWSSLVFVGRQGPGPSPSPE